MGEVWTAKDTKLGRDVAIKILPAEFTRDAERLARFEREARVLASLDDPGIAAIYGIEEAEGIRFLVMQLAEGEDLSERLRRGPMPVEETIPVAIRIAEALESAHDRGIIHRDLKPANIKIDADGKIRILDFGLAKALDTEEGDEDISNSPTMIRAATNAGVILGTAGYMSPEQARGKRVDKRADIWAFGVVLWEMLTGQRLFVGDTVSDTLAAVLKEEPDLETLPPTIPGSVRRVLRRCLQKNPKQRLHDIADARIELTEEESEESTVVVGTSSPTRSPIFAALPWLVAAIAVVIAAWVGLGSRPDEVSPRRVFAELSPPVDASFIVSRGLAISPDATKVVYAARSESGADQLWMVSLEDGSLRTLVGTEGGRHPFWSPDGRKVGFFTGGYDDSVLKIINVDNLVVETLAVAPGRPSGAWSESGVILFSERRGIFRVSANGGEAQEIDLGDSRQLEVLFPSFLPDGKHFLYLARNYYDSEPKRELRVGSVDGGASSLVMRINSNAQYAPSGELIWWENGSLRARPFDLESFEVTGEARLVSAGVQFDPRVGVGMFSVARDGTLVFRRGGIISGDELVSVDRDGNSLGRIGDPGNFYWPRLSPDGSLVAVDQSDETNRGDIWIYDVRRGTGTRLTSDPVDESDPAWSPDGEHVAFFSGLEGRATIHVRPVRGTGDERLLFEDPDSFVFPQDWSSTGFITFERFDNKANQSDIQAYSFEDESVLPITSAPFREGNSNISSDGRFVAYDSDETGRSEVYVQTFPDGANRWRVSTDGGSGPAWKYDGTEIYYQDDGGEIVAVTVREVGGTLEFGEPEPLFSLDSKDLSERQWDTVDGSQFVVNQRVDDLETTPLTIVLNALSGSSPGDSN